MHGRYVFRRMLECALAAGTSVGADGAARRVPTPAVAFLTVNHKYDAGIVISASHNPMEFNGIKIFNSQGFKLSDALEEEIEDLVLNGDGRIQTVTGADIGRVRNAEALENDYIEYLKGTISGDLSGLSIAVDCANGAASHTAQKLFTDLNAKCEFIFNKPDGTNKQGLRLHGCRLSRTPLNAGMTRESRSTGTRTGFWLWTRRARS